MRCDARNSDSQARRTAGRGARRDRRADRRRRGHHRRPRRRGGVSRRPAVARALPVQGRSCRSCRAPRSPAWCAARRPAATFTKGDRVAGLTMLYGAHGRSRCAATGQSVQAAGHGVVRGRRRAAVQRPHDASRAAHPRPAGRRRDRAGARRGRRHRHIDAATGARVGRVPHHRGRQHARTRSRSPRPRAHPMWCWPTASRTRSRS